MPNIAPTAGDNHVEYDKEVTPFLDVPLRITIELVRRSMKVREILTLEESSIVEFPKSAGESVDIYINNRLVGFGEVVELEGNAGIRLTDFLINP